MKGSKMTDRVQYGSQVLDRVWDLYDEARQSYLDHDGRFPGEKLRKLARYCLKVAGKKAKGGCAPCKTSRS